ncbi:hypothetical protein PR003_g12351 [Phytophthora rubi]|uniref:Uncharacterized protein n=1 Tax=Phytophthora rubi TaxID=129364 RepID=A0A6A3MG44_9STRA|nr:hypothetical protein PR002_g12046 [Phytophthora rubi]KAE9027534.1 hypothetical protein PR001_g11948 [Phytophthora rubi]KAE9336742.1 hypothetical protein PR003_g12351 [Phytophthora rubi]
MWLGSLPLRLWRRAFSLRILSLSALTWAEIRSRLHSRRRLLIRPLQSRLTAFWSSRLLRPTLS